MTNKSKQHYERRSHQRIVVKMRHRNRLLRCESLEERRLLAIDISDPLVNVPGTTSIAGPPDTVMKSLYQDTTF